MSFVALIIGLVIGWLACKLMAEKSIKTVEDVRSTASSAIDAAVEGTSAAGSKAMQATEGLAGKAAGAAGAAAQKAADSVNAIAEKAGAGSHPKVDELSDSLFDARKTIDEKENELRRVQSEIDAARRSVSAAKHQAGNHASTISSLRDEVAELSRKLQEAQEAAK